MNSLQSPISRPASLSKLLTRKRWIDPVASLGEHVMFHKGYNFWDPQGPALCTWQTLKTDLDKFLADKAAPNVRWTCYMSGVSGASAAPTVIFIGQGRGVRTTQKLARVILKQDQYLGFRSLGLDFDPGMRNLVPFTGSSSSLTAQDSVVQPGWRTFSGKQISIRQHWYTHQCVLIYNDGECRSRGVLSGPFQARGQRVFLMSAHVLTGKVPLDQELNPTTFDSAPLAFDSALDGDSDDADDFEDNQDMLVDLTSHGSISSQAYDSDDSSAQSHQTGLPPIQSPPEEPAISTDDAHFQSQPPMIPHLSADYEAITRPEDNFEVFFGSEYLDYALLMDPHCVLTGTFAGSELLSQSLVAKYNKTKDKHVWVSRSADATDAHGTFREHTVMFKAVQSGIIQGLLTYRPARTLDHQRLANWLQPGDSGALIHTADRSQLYGHVIAGDPSTGQAYVVPIQDVINDVEDNLDLLQRSCCKDPRGIISDSANNHTLKTFSNSEDGRCVAEPQHRTRSRSITPAMQPPRAIDATLQYLEDNPNAAPAHAEGITQVLDQQADLPDLELAPISRKESPEDIASPIGAAHATDSFGSHDDIVPATSSGTNRRLRASAPAFVPDRERQSRQSSAWSPNNTPIQLPQARKRKRDNMAMLPPLRLDVASALDSVSSTPSEPMPHAMGTFSLTSSAEQFDMMLSTTDQYYRWGSTTPLVADMLTWTHDQSDVNESKGLPPFTLYETLRSGYDSRAGSVISRSSGSSVGPSVESSRSSGQLSIGLYVCQHEDCGKEFRSKTEFSHHMRNHGERKHVCSICGKKFVFHKDLGRHQKIHTDERQKFGPIVNGCQWCKKGFQRKEHYERHMKTHIARGDVRNETHSDELDRALGDFAEESYASGVHLAAAESSGTHEARQSPSTTALDGLRERLADHRSGQAT